MILCVGEILADVIATQKGDRLDASFRCGGAPFNVAVHAKRNGATVGFLGRVGNDSVGTFLRGVAEKQGLDLLQLQVDEFRNTTLAFVSLKDGERDFTFLRHDSADFNIDVSHLDELEKDVTTVHLGSLMLSEKAGQEVAFAVAKWCKTNGKKLSFDVNYRQDVFPDESSATQISKRFVALADLVKLSLDEALMLTNCQSAKEAASALSAPNKLVVITLGSAGSYFFINGRDGVVSSQKVQAVDSTGAGDAFWGTLLAQLDGKEVSSLDDETIKLALKVANRQGAVCTLKKGAI